MRVQILSASVALNATLAAPARTLIKALAEVVAREPVTIRDCDTGETITLTADNPNWQRDFRAFYHRRDHEAGAFLVAVLVLIALWGWLV